MFFHVLSSPIREYNCFFFPIVFSVFRSDLKEAVNRKVVVTFTDDTKLFLILKVNADCRVSGLEGCVFDSSGDFSML